MKISSDEIRRIVIDGNVGKTGTFGGHVKGAVDSSIFAQARIAALNTPDIRQDEIDVLRARLDADSYPIDSDQVAEKLICRAISDQVE